MNVIFEMYAEPIGGRNILIAFLCITDKWYLSVLKADALGLYYFNNIMINNIKNFNLLAAKFV